MAQGPEARLLVWDETEDLTFFSAQVMRNDSRYSTRKKDRIRHCNLFLSQHFHKVIVLSAT